MIDDPSRGWDAIAATYTACRSDIGIEVVQRWAAHLRANGSVVDVGCGNGLPIGRLIASLGFDLYGIDPSPRLLTAFQRNLPGARSACEAAERSHFFDKQFDGAVAIGLIFLLPENVQNVVINRVAAALKPGGRLLFSAPRCRCTWNDRLTGMPSLSLGHARYRQLLGRAGCRIVASDVDAESNHYYHAVRDRG